MALPRLKTDMPNEVFPSNWEHKMSLVLIRHKTRFSPVHPCTYIREANGLLPFRVWQKLLVLLSLGFMVSVGQMGMNLWSQNSERRRWRRTNLHRRTWVSGCRFWMRVQQFPASKNTTEKRKHEAVQLWSSLKGKNIKFNPFIWNEARSGKTEGAGAATLAAVCEISGGNSLILLQQTLHWHVRFLSRIMTLPVGDEGHLSLSGFHRWGREGAVLALRDRISASQKSRNGSGCPKPLAARG